MGRLICPYIETNWIERPEEDLGAIGRRVKRSGEGKKEVGEKTEAKESGGRE